ncbi:MAG: hypothetical protein A2632_02895 [Candidatus Pacebacteria bacterium RIFCSPHIGHO2_01_FULL_46_16]|nr:MAG: hypothetical protein A2632_02895 [Candidatus Pacebacteria bacterium RIFCSPHIGHO2_01_FULL_46_16]OGJ38943.1 MAG: hypothetical protein A3A82_02210 [Candidatus Pacebacteria bacterium RIFCSPLOWO2_01_FULL_47_12]
MQKKYTTIGLGGTFDHFHLGHRQLLDRSATVAQKLLIGVTTDMFAQTLEKQRQEVLELFATRLASVVQYCKKQKYTCEVFALDNPFGPTLSPDTKVEALCVSTETRKTADKINLVRTEAGIAQLPIEEVALVKLADGRPLSSTLIRQGLVSRDGITYDSILKKSLVLTQSQRALFGKIQGEILEKPTGRQCLRCVVGDSSLIKFLAQHWRFDLAVFDYLIERRPYEPPVIAKEKIDLIATNPAGRISQHMTTVLRTALEKKMRYVFVEGEEDLAAVSLALLAPLGAEIYYGQPGVGLVCMRLTEDKKDEIYRVLRQ